MLIYYYTPPLYLSLTETNFVRYTVAKKLPNKFGPWSLDLMRGPRSRR